MKKALSRLSPQRCFSIAPLGKSIAPSSVTFGDSFPPRGSLRRCYTPPRNSFSPNPTPQNANPNQGTYTGPVIAPLSSRCATQRQSKTSEQRVVLKSGAGASPPSVTRLFASGLSLEKAWIPRRDRAKPRGRCQPAPVPAGPAADDGGPPGRCTPWHRKSSTTRRVRSTLPRPRPGPGGNPPRRS